MRIHDDEFTIGRILEQCRVDPQEYPKSGQGVVEGVDLGMLSRILRRLPVETVNLRRQRLNTFYEEILVSADAIRGISFHSCLMILAHHNVIKDSKSLRLEEFLRRRARLQRVEEAVRRNTVIGFFDTLYWSREFRRKVLNKKSARMSIVPQFTVPEIFVDDEYEYHDGGDNHEQSDNIVSQDVTTDSRRSSIGGVMGASAGDPDSTINNNDDMQPMLSPTSPNRPRGDFNLPPLDTGLAGRMSTANAAPSTEWSSISPSLMPGRGRAHTTSSYDPAPGPSTEQRDGTGRGPEPGSGTMSADHSRQNSAISMNDVMQSFDNSAWGESIRRSFTQRRPGDRRSGGYDP